MSHHWYFHWALLMYKMHDFSSMKIQWNLMLRIMTPQMIWTKSKSRSLKLCKSFNLMNISKTMVTSEERLGQQNCMPWASTLFPLHKWSQSALKILSQTDKRKMCDKPKGHRQNQTSRQMHTVYSKNAAWAIYENLQEMQGWKMQKYTREMQGDN